jgi:hypothetical protein
VREGESERRPQAARPERGARAATPRGGAPPPAALLSIVAAARVCLKTALKRRLRRCDTDFAAAHGQTKRPREWGAAERRHERQAFPRESVVACTRFLISNGPAPYAYGRSEETKKQGGWASH